MAEYSRMAEYRAAEYWVHENRTIGRARSRRAARASRNHGAGFHARDSAPNGGWHSPFRDTDAALAAPERAVQPDRGPRATRAP